MPVNEITVDAPPPTVWDVLADPPSYEEWVVGKVFAPLIKLRNAETLRRLKHLAESRHRAPATRG